MRCECCIALRCDTSYEYGDVDCWCAVGEEEIEFTDGTIGCRRRSINKLKKDIETQRKIEEEAFVKEAEAFYEFTVEVNEIQSKYNVSFEHACCYICNFEDNFICRKFNGGCENIEQCKNIREKELLNV